MLRCATVPDVIQGELALSENVSRFFRFLVFLLVTYPKKIPRHLKKCHSCQLIDIYCKTVNRYVYFPEIDW